MHIRHCVHTYVGSRNAVLMIELKKKDRCVMSSKEFHLAAPLWMKRIGHSGSVMNFIRTSAMFDGRLHVHVHFVEANIKAVVTLRQNWRRR